MTRTHPDSSRPRPARIDQPWGERTPYGPGQDWPVRIDQHLDEGVSVSDVGRWVPTASILQSNGDPARAPGLRALFGLRVLSARISSGYASTMDHSGRVPAGLMCSPGA